MKPLGKRRPLLLLRNAFAMNAMNTMCRWANFNLKMFVLNQKLNCQVLNKQQSETTVVDIVTSFGIEVSSKGLDF